MGQMTADKIPRVELPEEREAAKPDVTSDGEKGVETNHDVTL